MNNLKKKILHNLTNRVVASQTLKSRMDPYAKT